MMKRNLILAIFVVAVIGGINVFNVQHVEGLSDVALANVEALVRNESSTETTWSCKGVTGTCKAECGLCGTKIGKSKGTLTGYHKCSL